MGIAIGAGIIFHFLLSPSNPCQDMVRPCVPTVSPTASLNPAPVGAVVTLNANPSDAGCPACIPLFKYLWSMTSSPQGSSALLSNPTLQNPAFTPDVSGSYQFGVIATDSLGQKSPPSLITISGVPPTTTTCLPNSFNYTSTQVVIAGPNGTCILYYYPSHDSGIHADISIDQVMAWRDIRFSQLSDSISAIPPEHNFASSNSNATLQSMVGNAKVAVHNSEFLYAILILHQLENATSGSGAYSGHPLITNSTYRDEILYLTKGIENTTTLAATTGTPVQNYNYTSNP